MSRHDDHSIQGSARTDSPRHTPAPSGTTPWLVLGSLSMVLMITTVLHAKGASRDTHATAMAETTIDPTLIANAHWERRWLPQASVFSVESGWVQLSVRPQEHRLDGLFIMVGARTDNGILHAALPPGVENLKATVQCRGAAFEVEHDHLAIQVGKCPTQGCVVEVTWTLDTTDWRADGNRSWLGPNGYRLRAADVMPRLGLDTDRIVQTPAERIRLGLTPQPSLPPHGAALAGNAAAPAADWRWIVRLQGVASDRPVRRGNLSGPLDFADVWIPDPAMASNLRDRVSKTDIEHAAPTGI